MAAQLKAVSEKLSGENTSDLPTAQAKKIRTVINEAYEKLRAVIDNLDPIKHPGFVFDPSNPSIVGRFVAITMIAQPRKPLKNIDRFYGSGVYALYYTGKFEPYSAISNRENPLYVGKADPALASSKTAYEQGDRLARRLLDHQKNIQKARSTLSIEDFQYRALVVQSGWQISAENYLIHIFKPIWNAEVNICYGFGKHGDSPTTRANLRSPWDTLHPGRDWAHRDLQMKDARSVNRVISDIKAHLQKYPPLETVEEILRVFLREITAVT